MNPQTAPSPLRPLHAARRPAMGPQAMPSVPAAGLQTSSDPTAVEQGVQPLERLLLRHDGRLQVLRLTDVDWIEGAGNYVRLHFGGSSERYRTTLGSLEPRLDPRRFVRIHRSAIVNVDGIAELRPKPSGCYDLTLRGGAELTLSRSHRRRVLELMGRERA
jgi:DNA-binding LytR/AlgR family response regulator